QPGAGRDRRRHRFPQYRACGGGRRADDRRGLCGIQHAGSRARGPRAQSGGARRRAAGRRPSMKAGRSPQSQSRVRVRYAETDQMGVVYYANYFVWFEVGRADLLREAGWSYREMETEGFALPVIEAHCAYRESAKYDDDLEVRTTGAMLSPVRVQFTYEVVRLADTATLAIGATIHATLDRGGRPCRLPDRVRTLFL